MVLREIVVNGVEKSEPIHGRPLVLSWWICTLFRVAYPWEHCITKVSNRSLQSYDKIFGKKSTFFSIKRFSEGFITLKKMLRTTALLEMKCFMLWRCFWKMIDYSVWFTLNYLEDKKMELQGALVSTLCGIHYEHCILKS